MNTSIFKTYDIRGVYPTEINEETVKIVARACAQMFPEGEIIVGYDVRRGSPELAAAFEQTLITEAKNFKKKVTVRNIGLASTPMFYFSVNHFTATGGCMVTASHNPKEYNGLKIVRAGAEMISGLEILDFINKNKLT